MQITSFRRFLTEALGLPLRRNSEDDRDASRICVIDPLSSRVDEALT